MSQMLPTGKFQWLTQDEIDSIDIKSLADDSKIGYIFEVDLVYPHSLHDKHNDYPLAPKKLDIDETMLSEFQQKFPKDQKKKSKKLAPNIQDKDNYVVHFRNLKCYLEQVLILKKIHRVLSYKHTHTQNHTKPHTHKTTKPHIHTKPQNHTHTKP